MYFEYSLHGVGVGWWYEVHDEMSHEAARQGVSPAAWRSAGARQNHV